MEFSDFPGGIPSFLRTSRVRATPSQGIAVRVPDLVRNDCIAWSGHLSQPPDSGRPEASEGLNSSWKSATPRGVQRAGPARRDALRQPIPPCWPIVSNNRHDSTKSLVRHGQLVILGPPTRP